MNNGEKLNYIKRCLDVASDEYGYLAWEATGHFDVGFSAAEADRYASRNDAPNKALIVDNLRNVARIAFRIANDIDHNFAKYK